MLSRKRHYNYALGVAFVLILCDVPVEIINRVAGDKCPSEGLQFEVRTEYQWTKESDAAFPNVVDAITPGFKMLTCATHNSKFRLWESGTPCVDEMKQFFYGAVQHTSLAEIEPFDNIYDLYNPDEVQNPNINAFGPTRDSDDTGLVFSIGIDAEGGEDNFTIEATPEFPYISCFAMIWPSADWFVGVSNVDVCNDTSKTLQFRLNAFDAGLYRSPNYAVGSDSDREQPPNPFVRQVRVVAPNGYGSLTITNDYSKPLADPKDNANSAVCFPADELVTLASGKKVRMDHLSVGDVVMTYQLSHPSTRPLSHDEKINSTVYAFSHRLSFVMASFLHISYVLHNDMPSQQRHIRLSPSHYIYCYKSSTPVHSPPELVPASDLHVGNFLLTAGPDHAPVLAKVVKIHLIVARGLYNPHTFAGHMIVSGVVVSCYTEVVDPRIAVAALAPVRCAHQVGLWSMANRAVSFVSDFARRVVTLERLPGWVSQIERYVG